MERWLSLKILESPLPPHAGKARVQISVPKRTVKLAVTRNRIKRVLREAIRRDPFFASGPVCRLQVRRLPKTIGLVEARNMLEALHD